MELKEQVITLEQAKRLKDLGVGYNDNHEIKSARKYQQATFYWRKDYIQQPNGGESKVWGLCILGDSKNNYSSPNYYDNYYAAFTVAELGEMLPMGVNSEYAANFPDRNLQGYICSGMTDEYTIDYKIRIFKTEAESRADALIYLLENHLI